MSDLKLDFEIQKSIDKISFQTIGRVIGAEVKMKNDLSISPISKEPRFTVDIDIGREDKKALRSTVIQTLMPTIHNDNSISCTFFTETGIFPSNRKRINWSSTNIFENEKYCFTVSSLAEKKNALTGVMEKQSTNQSDLDILYAILAHFSNVKQEDIISIDISSIRKLLGMKKGGKQNKMIKQSIDRIDGLQIFVYDKSNKSEVKINFFDGLGYRYDNVNNLTTISVKLNRYIFNRILKKPIFIPIKKRGMINSLIGKWLLSYIYEHLPRPFDITVDEVIKRSGFVGRKRDLVGELKKNVHKINELNVCQLIISVEQNFKITFLKNPKV